MVLLPTFRLPDADPHAQPATRSGCRRSRTPTRCGCIPTTPRRLGVEVGDLVRVSTRIGYFVPRVWVTEGIHPGIVACSHHVGRWRMSREIGGQKLASSLVDVQREGERFTFRQREGATAYDSKDRDTKRVWWEEVGVNQNLTFPVQPDPVSGMHCWHQRVTVERAQPGDRYGDIQVDLAKSEAVFDEWLKMTKPAPGPGGLRRPLTLNRPFRPTDDAYKLD